MQRVAARPGDWKCGGRLCQAHNFASKTKCFKCGNPKPGTRGSGRPGDWACSACQANNYANKLACYKCGKQKPPPSKEQPPAADPNKPKRVRKKKKRAAFENTGVYFSNLPKGVLLFDVQQKVRELCMPFGTLRRVNPYRSKEDENLSQGDALAVFTSKDDADRAVAALQSHPVYSVSRANFQPKAKKAADSAPGNGGGAGTSASSSVEDAPGAPAAAAPAAAVPLPALSVEQSSTSDTVFIAMVFDLFAETSKQEAELKTKCESFGNVDKWFVDDPTWGCLPSCCWV